MPNIIYETGEISELGETMSFGKARFYTHIELKRDDDSRVRLNDVIVSHDVSPKLFVEHEKATFAFINMKGEVLNGPIMLAGTKKNMAAPRRYFRNVVIGYGNDHAFGVDREADSLWEHVSMAATVLIAMATGYMALHGWPWGFFLIPGFLLLLTGATWQQYARGRRWRKEVLEKFAEMGFVDKVSKVYS